MRINKETLNEVADRQNNEGIDKAVARLCIDEQEVFNSFLGVCRSPVTAALMVGSLALGVELGIQLDRSKQTANHPDPEKDHGHEDEFLESLPEAEQVRRQSEDFFPDEHRGW